MSTLSTIDEALESIRNGRLVILVDDEDRENEGDLVFPAELITPEVVNFMATHGRGLICLSLEPNHIEKLRLPMMTMKNKSSRQTAFTVSIEAKEGVGTGISAADRAHTIRTAVDPASGPDDLISPGHVFPLKAVDGGVLVRTGHTEGSIDLVRLAGFRPAAVICEIMNEDGTMARLADLKEFVTKHEKTLGKIPIVSIKDLIAYRISKESLIQQVAVTDFPSEHGHFKMHAFRSIVDDDEHLALVKGDLRKSGDSLPLVRVHSECLTGDALFSQRCDCGHQLASAMRMIENSGKGVLVYMRRHEGRGIGLTNKLKAYELQDQGMDTVEANRHLGFQPDLRRYGTGAQILRSLGVTKLRLLTNNPKKVVGLEGYGLEITETVPIEVEPTPFNVPYLKTKRDKLGHQILKDE